MTEPKLKKKNWQGIGIIPFFNDPAVYDAMKFISSKRNIRLGTLVIEAVEKSYLEREKKEMVYNDGMEFLLAIRNVKRDMNERPADYIEKACKNYANEFLKKLEIK